MTEYQAKYIGTVLNGDGSSKNYSRTFTIAVGSSANVKGISLAWENFLDIDEHSAKLITLEDVDLDA